MIYVNPKFQSGETSDVRQSLLRLIHASRDRVMAYVGRQIPADLRRLVEPEDIFQGVCFKASSQAHCASVPADPDEALRWLMTIARNLLIDRVRELRAQKRGGNRITDEEIRHGSMVIMLEELAVYHRTPSASAAAHEFLDTLERTLLLLPADQQCAVRMRYVEGLSLAEVAARMERSEGSVQKLSARGLAALREHLQTASMYL
ncbi:MAG TPA: RNA polymerase sigma factor [Tepidisphaeraceae bacterium]|jgi:RNA polymerase sigma factor (sigma-70 family)